MLIANRKREENIAEYLLYMWQVEDLIRANNLDIELISKNIIDQYDQPEDVKTSIREWYENLIEMMIHDEVQEKGHLQINKNVISNLADLHNALLKLSEHADYNTMYYKTLPYIVELRAKGADKSESEVETCFSALYGFLLLKIQDREVSGETQAAISQIGSFLRLLAIKYKQYKEGLLENLQ